MIVVMTAVAMMITSHASAAQRREERNGEITIKYIKWQQTTIAQLV